MSPQKLSSCIHSAISSGAGGWLLVIGVTLACGGLLWSDRITARVLI
jgi:Flp pilus assembly protein TadB